MAEIVYGEGTTVKVIAPEVKAPEVKAPEKTEYTAIEQEAIDQGWDPNFEGDNKRSAREFVDRGELLGKIKSQSQEIREVKRVADALALHNKNVFVAAHEKALKDLTEAKIKALDEGGKGKKVVKLDEAIDQTRIALAQARSLPVAQQSAGESAVFVDFKKNNPLYEKDEDFKDWAHGVAISFAKAHDNATEAQVYEFISERAKKKYPDQTRRGPPSPDGEGRSGGSTQVADKGSNKAFDALIARLPEEHAAVAKDLVKRGYVTKEKYVQDYQALEG